MKAVIGIIILGAVVGGLYVLNDITRTDDGRSVLHVATELPITVAVSEPQQRSIVRTVQAPGDVEPFFEVDISAEVVAKILEMPVEEGDSVSKGDLLCRLDDADYQARVASAEANVAKLRASITQAEAELEKADRDFKRQVKLSEAEATSSLELADYHTALVRYRALLEMRRQELIEAEARLASAREDLAKTIIRSPIDGVVAQLFAKQGEVVVTGTMNNPGTRIMVVSDLSKMQVRCRVDESEAPLVKEDQPARIYLQSDTQDAVPGTVLRVAAKGTKAQGRDVVTFETLVVVNADDERVKPGMTANVEIEVAQSDEALTIPVEAVVQRKRKDLPEAMVAEFDEQQKERAPERHVRVAEYLDVIFCVNDDVAHPHLIETGISDATSVEIVNGVALGDRVVIGPYRSLDQLKDGSKIKIEDEEKSKEEATTGEEETREASDDDTKTEAVAEGN